MNCRNSMPPPVLQYESPLPAWFKPRGYLHFDSQIGFSAAERLVSNPENVATCSFFPLIGFEKKSVQLRFDSERRKPAKKIKVRPIAYASHRDSHIYKYYAHILSARYESSLAESNLGQSVLAFRAIGKGNVHFAKSAFDAIRRMGNCTALAFDIEKFFDRLDHSLIKKRWAHVLGVDRLPEDHFAVFRSLTSFSIVDKKQLYRTLGLSPHKRHSRCRICTPADFRNKVRAEGLIKTNAQCFGIPQGTPISGLIANIYMFEIDQQLNEAARAVNGIYLRYCDDILLVVPSGSSGHIESLVTSLINEVKLSLSISKTTRSVYELDDDARQRCDRSLQYLGFDFDGQRILIRSASLAHHSQAVRRGVKLAVRTMQKRNREREMRGLPSQKLYRRKLYSRYSHFGKQNFLRYAYRSARILESDAILKQLKPLWKRLQRRVDSAQR